MTPAVRRTTILYGTGLAAAIFIIQWLEYRHVARLLSTEIYIVLLAVLFTGLGIWIGLRLNKPATPAEFRRNRRVIQTLGLTARELEVLELLARGESNKEIASRLFVSTSTVKTHLVHIYQKLDVLRRTQAVQKAKELQIIP